MRIGVLFAVFLAVLLSAIVGTANDPPHNDKSGVTCDGCHGEALFLTNPLDLPAGSEERKALYDNVCTGTCHTDTTGAYHATTAPVVKGHKDAKCIDCHQGHYQYSQSLYGIRSYPAYYILFSGTALSVTPDNDDPDRPRTVVAYNPASLSVKGSSQWDTTGPPDNDIEAGLAMLAAKTSDGRGALFLPNSASAFSSMMVEFIDTAADTITLKGTLSYAPASFGLAYGQLINHDVPYASASGEPVLFFDNTGEYSFADNDTLAAGNDSTPNGICQVCHEPGVVGHWQNTGAETDHHSGENCTKSCHLHTDGFLHGGVVGGGESCATATYCHGGSHYTHLSGMLPGTECDVCHDLENLRDESDNILFKDGKVLAETGVCEPCHSADGASLAKQYFAHLGSNTRTDGSWAVEEGEKSYCGSCHDATPGYNDATAAPNILGDDSAYGFYITGHGKETGNYQKLSWQDGSETTTGNPAANLQRCDQCHGMPPVEDGWPVPPDPPDIPGVTPCGFCHDLTAQHFATSDKRLRAGFENDQANSNCKNCHSSDGSDGTAATNEPHFYTNSAQYESSAHKDKLCTDCHDVHGASGAYIGMMKENQENLCDNCHSNGGHPGVGSASFVHDSKTYTLECVSCHNVHVVSGTYAQADQNKTPVSKFSDNTNAWGDETDEKMDYYAGTGTYQTPKGESFTGAQLPDYASFCTDCHSQPGNPPFGINWTNDPHGKNSANQPNGYGTCPNWYTCGKAESWDGDDCIAADPDDCWPVMTRGLGDQLWSRSAYTHEERIGGANFTLSCTDCHTGHGTGTLGRSNVNGGSFSGTWNSMCNNCHYYYSDWHAGMSCGNASCHVSNRMNYSGSTPHEMSNSHGSGGTRTFNSGLVLYYAFENDFKDSGSWQMDGRWMDNLAGSFAAGKSGQAVVLDGGKNVQVGTENTSWSTDEGAHGTWKYTEMKFNTTLEAWVYPTDDAKSEYSIFTKHVGYANGGYAFTLQKIGGSLRAAFNMQADNNGTGEDGRAGIRGAYSSISVPLNTWTHVAATFNTAGPDMDPGDPAVGRIRIYVNGIDVTTSDSSGNLMQPGANETSIFAYSENSPWNQAICNSGHWCASEFSVGGFYGWQNAFIGRIDEAKVWNVTKDAAYFSSYEAQAGPYISSVEGLIGSQELTVTFSEGVYADTGRTGNLQAADIILTDANGDNPRTISVSHTAGSSTAVITMSQPLIVADINADTLGPAANAIYDEDNNAAGAGTVTISLSDQCPPSPVDFQFEEANGSAYIMDSQNVLYGEVIGAGALTGHEFSGDGSGSNYINFEFNDSCLQAETKMTLEARIKPTGIGTDNYINRILARDGGGNYQMSVWRNNGWTNYNAPDNTASIALWVYPLPTVGNAWKPVLTDYDLCPIVNDHWYQIKAVWDSDIVGAMPGKIYVDDQGTDGTGTGENWADSIDCTNNGQSYNDQSTQIINEGDTIKTVNGNFTIGINSGNHTGNNFNGLIDWIRWQDSVE